MYIKIAGAGLSGLSCALNLAKNDIKVDVFERENCVGKKYGLSVLAFKAYETNILEELKSASIPTSNLFPIYKIRRYAPSMRYFETYSNKPLYFSVIRGPEGSLEEMLLNECMDRNVQFFFNQTSNADVIATGARFTHFIGISKTFKNKDKLDHISLFYSPLASGGYFYIIPYGDYITAGGVFDAASVVSPLKNFNEFFHKKLGLTENAIHTVVSKANYFHSSCFDKLYVGEAAGLLEPSRGFGMRTALISGKLAADAISNRKDYNNSLSSLFKELAKGEKIRDVYSLMEESDFERLIDFMGQNLSIEEYKAKKELLQSRKFRDRLSDPKE